MLWGGIWLPPIAPQSDTLHTALWNAHFYLAFVFFAVVLMHVAAALFHALVRRDGVFEAMGPRLTHDEIAPASNSRSLGFARGTKTANPRIAQLQNDVKSNDLILRVMQARASKDDPARSIVVRLLSVLRGRFRGHLRTR